MVGSALKNESLSVVTWKANDWPLSSGGPTDMPVAHPRTDCGPESSATLWSEPLVNVGASLTAVTAMLAVSVAMLNAVVPPLVLGSATPPFVPEDWSHARKVIAGSI